ncbi:hypothetical protein ACIRU3_07085 [Streptomyces sp. NPDC101151]|uniref:hypothetical protein n=1 Tax=Streptomyces sp. NPDC101151 TaxID=3366115 RepID=UPI00381B5BD4
MSETPRQTDAVVRLVQATVKTTGGHSVTISRPDVGAVALDQPDYTAYGRNDHWVVADVAGRLIPVVPLMRAVLDGAEPVNTHAAEIALRELGFRIFVTRLYTPSGRPVTLTNDQTAGARP